MRKVILRHNQDLIAWESVPGGGGVLQLRCNPPGESTLLLPTRLPENLPTDDLRYLSVHAILPALHASNCLERLVAIALNLDPQTLASNKFVTGQMARSSPDRYPAVADYVAAVEVLADQGL